MMVDNGKRITLSHPSADGDAGLVRDELAFRLVRGSRPPRVGDLITVEGMDREISRVQHNRSTGFVRLTLAVL